MKSSLAWKVAVPSGSLTQPLVRAGADVLELAKAAGHRVPQALSWGGIDFATPQGLKWVQGGTCLYVFDGPIYGHVETLSDGAVG